MKSSLHSSYLSDYLKPSQIIYDLKATDKVQALEELLDVLAKQKLVENKKLILTRIIDRERLEPTAIGHSVALPHARVNTGGDIAIAVGKSKKGIDFDAIDDKDVHIIILVIWNPSLPGLFNHLFAGLAQFLIRDDFRRRLFGAKNKTELYNVLSEVELRLPQLDRIISRASLLKKLQTIEIKMKKSRGSQRKQLKEQADLIRQELDRDLVDRYERLMHRYGFAVAEVDDGVCQGCNINVATGIGSAIEGSNDIYICENCGKFLVASNKKKK
jgi:mannitol/fructose-specific phosphotransferase system IIA component (Ntr-type)